MKRPARQKSHSNGRAARGWTADVPSRAYAVTWYPWFSVTLGRHVPRRSFTPVPSVDAAVLTAMHRAVPLLPHRYRLPFTNFVAAGFRASRAGDLVAATAGRRAVGAVCRKVGVDPAAPPFTITAPAWTSFFVHLNMRA